MNSVPSVRGPVQLDDLAPTLYHEHVVIDLRTVPGAGDLWLADRDQMAEELQVFADRGGRTVVSLTNGSMGRDIEALREISVRSGVNILTATGQYTRKASAAIRDIALLADRFEREITVGIDDTDVRAAVIGEIATGPHPISEYERSLFVAAARAHVSTQAPIATHTHNGLYARWQLRTLMSLQVDPARVVIGHMAESTRDGKPDVRCMAELAAEGAFVGIDTIGLANYYSENLGRFMPSDEARADAIADLVQRGFADHILLSHDLCRRIHLKANGGCGYGHIHDHFLKMLEVRGVDHGVSSRFIGANPVRWLTGNRLQPDNPFK